MKAWKRGGAVHLSPPSDCGMTMMAVASMYRNYFLLQRLATNAHNQILELYLCWLPQHLDPQFSVELFSDHVELHRCAHIRVSAPSCVQPISSSISHDIDDNTFSPYVIIPWPGNTSCTACSLMRVEICYHPCTQTPASYLKLYSFLRRTSVYLYPFFGECQL